jgi:hypothetical protein
MHAYICLSIGTFKSKKWKNWRPAQQCVFLGTVYKQIIFSSPVQRSWNHRSVRAHEQRQRRERIWHGNWQDLIFCVNPRQIPSPHHAQHTMPRVHGWSRTVQSFGPTETVPPDQIFVNCLRLKQRERHPTLLAFLPSLSISLLLYLRQEQEIS